MRRRRFLAAVGVAAGLAGCSATPDVASSDSPTLTPVDPASTPTDTETPTDTPDEEPLGRLGTASVVDLQTVPRTYALAPTRYRSDDDARVEVGFTATATADHPARVRGRLTNAAPWANTFRLDETPPFGRRTGGITDEERELTYRAGLVFAPTENHELADRVPDVEPASDGTWRLAEEIEHEWTPDTVRLAAEESVTGEWVLVGRAPGTETGRPTGRYVFRSGETDLTVTVWNTHRPGPSRDSRFAGRSVGSFPGGAVDWFHAADPATPAYLEPSTERIGLPGAIDLTLVNHSHRRLTGNSWNLYKHHEGRWHHVAPWAHTAVLRVIPPGGRRQYRLRLFNGESLPSDGLDLGHLGGGTYAFESMYDVEGLGHFAALFEVEGPSVTVAPTEGVTAERDGATVRAEWTHRPALPRATLVVERLGPEVAAGETLIPEQVMRRRYRGLRNSLPFFESGVTRVRLRTDRNTVSSAAGASGYQRATRRFTFDGDVFEATARFREEERSGTATASDTA